MKKLLSLVLSALLLACTPTFAGQETDRLKMSKDHQRVYDAALALYASEGDITHFLCSTTVVARRASMEANSAGKNQYLLLTAGHCVTGDGLPEDLVFGVREDIKEESPKPELMEAKVVKAENDAKYDFALLTFYSDKDFPTIEIDWTYVPTPEDKVYDVNFSLGVAKQVALGAVATKIIDNQGSDKGCDICQGKYLVHIFAAGGASGSAIISDKTNKIIGVGEFGFPGTTTGLGCETTSALKEWINLPVASISPNGSSLQAKAIKQ